MPDESGAIYVNFDQLPTSTVHFRAVSENGDNMSTVKYAPEMIAKSQPLTAVVYEHRNSEGRVLGITQDIPDLSKYDFDNIISSYSIPENVRLQFFSGKNYTGGYYTRDAGVSDANGFENKVQSVRVLKNYHKKAAASTSLEKEYLIEGHQELTLTAPITIAGNEVAWNIPSELKIVSKSYKSITLKAQR